MISSLSLRAPRGKLIKTDTQKGIDELTLWISDRKSNFSAISEKLDVDGHMVDASLEIVRKYIIDRKLILFGGLAIDYALRLKGSYIYSDDQRPDFDVLSTNSVEDAYDLVDLLITAGYTDVQAVRGIHVQTMRVRVDFNWVADIGYIPETVKNNIPTLDYNGITIVHPDYQRIDLHLSMCYPFNDAPREVIFHRWKKDMTRYTLINKFYPLSTDNSRQVASASRQVASFDQSLIDNKNVAIHGFTAYALIRNTIDELIDKFKTKSIIPITAPKLHVKITKNTIETEIPDGIDTTIFVASCEPDLFVSNFDTYRPYMDAWPSVRKNKSNGGVLEIPNRLTSISILQVDSGSVQVVCINFILLFFMVHYYMTQNEIYKNYYLWTVELITVAEDLFSKLKDQKSALRLFLDSPFAPNITTMGSRNMSDSYIARLQKIQNTLGVLKVAQDNLPKNYFPPKKRRPNTFDYSTSAFFKHDGGKE